MNIEFNDSVCSISSIMTCWIMRQNAPRDVIICRTRINVVEHNNQNSFKIFLTSLYGLTIYHNALGIMLYVYVLWEYLVGCFDFCVYVWFYTFTFFLRIGGTLHLTPTITGPGMW